MRAVKTGGTVLDETAAGVTVRAFPNSGATALWRRRVVRGRANGWQMEQLRTEEGRLDEVFRSITMPDTAGKEAQT